MNKVILIGNLTRDPETGKTPSGVDFCRFAIAVSREYADANGNRETDFFNITTWRKQAENCGKYLKKGNKVAICGQLQNRKVEDGNGNIKTYTDVVANEVEFLTPKTKEESEEQHDTQTAVRYRQQEIDVPQRPRVDNIETRPYLEPMDDNQLPF